MKYLFDSKGKHIANEVKGQLHGPTGENIGHFLQQYNIFVDMSGKYLGEIYSQNRLIFNESSPYKSAGYGICGNYGNVGNYGNPGNYGTIGLPGNFRDVIL